MSQPAYNNMDSIPVTNIFIGRQPIYNRNLGIEAFELLFRSCDQVNKMDLNVDGDQATSQVILNAFLEIGLERLVKNNRAAINVTEQFLLGEHALSLPPDRVIIEVLENVPPSKEIIQALHNLSDAGFTIALDDFVYHKLLRPLVGVADIIKIDLRKLNKENIISHLKSLRKIKQTKFIAEKVETLEEYEFCLDLGFDMFQGYFLSRPKIIKSDNLPTNRVVVMNLMATLHSSGADTRKIEAVISSDVALSYKILRLINSAFFGLHGKVDSPHHAIILLGRRKLITWASMLALTSIDDQPPHTIHIAMVRARMCELIAEKAGQKPPENYFTVGMFSALDIIMQRPLEKLIKPLPLTQEVQDSILNKKGFMGDALKCVLAYEVSDWENVCYYSLSKSDLAQIGLEAFTFADDVMKAIARPTNN